ncbi:MAG: DNA-directed RNA polymerase subunit K [Desulfurococcales archaeon]|nr:DNA-directed RNA polymerase subunit K [Desulfurococcales archaeon]MEB3806914.1 DNA-directed RNA polymerase subunit K [Desulfurococcales archaeon]
MNAEFNNNYPVIDERVRIGPPYLTRYEKARIIGVRTYQLSIGIPPLVPPDVVGSKNPVDIARYEVEKGILPISVFRYHTSGYGQAIPLKVLLELGMKLGVE